ncbi:DNA polymerase sliding clamp [Halorubrum saccharovorum DSM 1137]|uniref:DNA polymerase sliding clamp n=1 Tax=Halorubrum saccharovorum DSM 1137 TaxID=1227484 RepID=M0DX86_9EURY|nr:DNA polymerase sliding clamp [Halorubrum saccharovorum]ELZ39337.1 DNA polymerase sliding clamp [Halorubrum saccharovorum DSM 1137]
MSGAETVSADATETSAGFKAIGEQQYFAEFFEQFDAIADEMKLHLDDGGLFGIVVDPANVGMCRDSLDREALEHYSATGGVIGLNLSRILDILGMGNSEDLVELELDTETRKLHIQVDGLSYTLALIDPDSIRKEPEIPDDLDLPATMTVDFADLKRGITAADMVSDHIRFRTGTSEEGKLAVYVEAEGDTDDVDLELTHEKLVAIDAEPGDGDSLFSLDYLKDIKKPIPKDAEVRIELGEEHPIKFHYGHTEMGDGGLAGDCTVMLAPRVQSD